MNTQTHSDFIAYYLSGPGPQPWLRRIVLLFDDGRTSEIVIDRASGDHDPRLPARKAGEGPIRWPTAVSVGFNPQSCWYHIGVGRDRFAGLARDMESAGRLLDHLRSLRDAVVR